MPQSLATYVVISGKTDVSQKYYWSLFKTSLNQSINQSLFVWIQLRTKVISWHFPNRAGLNHTSWLFQFQGPNMSPMSKHLATVMRKKKNCLLTKAWTNISASSFSHLLYSDEVYDLLKTKWNKQISRTRVWSHLRNCIYTHILV